tara:strand:+ start:1174 stop:1524 length:351 start_codon:yes stop_codon:yes gene_type:complete
MSSDVPDFDAPDSSFARARGFARTGMYKCAMCNEPSRAVAPDGGICVVCSAKVKVAVEKVAPICESCGKPYVKRLNTQRYCRPCLGYDRTPSPKATEAPKVNSSRLLDVARRFVKP